MCALEAELRVNPEARHFLRVQFFIRYIQRIRNHKNENFKSLLIYFLVDVLNESVLSFPTCLTSYRVLIIVLRRRQFSEDKKKPIMHSKLAIVFVHYVHK